MHKKNSHIKMQKNIKNINKQIQIHTYSDNEWQFG